MSEQSLSWFRVYGAIIVRSANRRSLIWSWWRSSAQRRRRRRPDFDFEFELDSSLLLSQLHIVVATTWGVLCGRIWWPDLETAFWVPPTLAKHFQVTFQIFSNVFFYLFLFFIFFRFFFGKVSCSPTETMETEGDTFFFVRIVFHYFVARLFVIHLRACVCVYVYEYAVFFF